MIGPQEVKRLLDYNPLTGVFIWRDRPEMTVQNRGHYAGKEAGALGKNGYRYVCVDGKHYLAHRLAWAIMMDEWPEAEIDHIDRSRANNSFSNLRLATTSQNQANTQKRSTNTSGFKGVSFLKRRRRWRARITLNYRETLIGYFKTAEEANKAYEAKAKQLFGDFAIAA